MSIGRKSAPRGSAKPGERGRESMGPPPRERKAESARDVAEDSRGPGRPPEGPAGESRTVMLMTRWTPAERAELTKRSAAAGVSVAEYVRRAALG